MVPICVDTILISIQHDETVTNDKIVVDSKECVIMHVIPEKYLDGKSNYFHFMEVLLGGL